MNAGNRVRIFHRAEIGKVEQVGGGFVVVLLDKPRADGAERVRILNKGVAIAAIRASASEIRKTCGMVAIAAPPAGSRNVNKGAIALSAYATRKTAQVTTQILLTSQRP